MTRKILELLFSMEGRISRGLLWGAMLIYLIVYVPIASIIEISNPQSEIIWIAIFDILAIPIYGKRFHDRNKSAWWVLVGQIPIIGTIWIFIECGFLAGTPGPNRFGLPNLAGSESRIMKEHANQAPGPDAVKRTIFMPDIFVPAPGHTERWNALKK